MDTVAIDILINVWVFLLLLLLLVLFCAWVIYHPGMISVIQLNKLF